MHVSSFKMNDYMAMENFMYMINFTFINVSSLIDILYNLVMVLELHGWVYTNLNKDTI